MIENHVSQRSHHEDEWRAGPSNKTEILYIFIFAKGNIVICIGIVPPIGKLFPDTLIKYCI